MPVPVSTGIGNHLWVGKPSQWVRSTNSTFAKTKV